MAKKTSKSTKMSRDAEPHYRQHPPQQGPRHDDSKSSGQSKAQKQLECHSTQPSPAKYLPVVRGWPTAGAGGQFATNNATSDCQHDPFTRWLSSPQHEQPWNAVGSINMHSSGPGSTDHMTGRRMDGAEHAAQREARSSLATDGSSGTKDSLKGH